MIAPSVLGPLGKNTNLDHIEINTDTLNKLLSNAKCTKIDLDIKCIEQIDLKNSQKSETIAVQQAKKSGIYKKGYDYLLLDLTTLTIAKDHIRLGIKQQENNQSLSAFIDELNTWYVDSAWTFVLSGDGQIFLESKTAFQIKTYPTNFVSGKNISHFMPQSENENWLHIINELQMIIFQTENLKNKAIKNIWLWGEQKIQAINGLIDEQTEVLFYNESETALLEQDSEKWLSSLQNLDNLLKEKSKNFKNITLLLDYQHLYQYKKPTVFSITNLPFLKTPTLHKWIQINGK